MSKTKLSNLLVNTQANAGAALYAGGYARIYGGEQPPNPDAAITGQTLLVEGRFSDPAWAIAVNGELSANAMTFGAVLVNGDAAFVRYLSADGVTVLHDDDVGLIGSGAGIEIENIALVEGAPFALASLYHTVPRS